MFDTIPWFGGPTSRWDKALHKGESSSSSSTSSNSTYTPAQSAAYGVLVNDATKWLESGGLIGTGGQQEDNISAAIKATGDYYSDVLTGSTDRAALDQAKQANVDAATTTFERSTMPAITDQAQQAGQVGSSRQGIATGLAASDMQQQVGNQNAQMEYQWQTQQQQNQQAAAKGLLSTANAYGQLQDSQAANSDSAMALQTLMAYRDLISGNFGGTTEGTSNTSGTSDGGSSGVLGLAAAGIGAAGQLLS